MTQKKSTDKLYEGVAENVYQPSPLEKARDSAALRLKPVPLLLVSEVDGRIECQREGDTGMYVVGRGATVAEAVGMWAIYSQAIVVLAHPDPSLIETRFRIHPTKKVDKRRYIAADRRD